MISTFRRRAAPICGVVASLAALLGVVAAQGAEQDAEKKVVICRDVSAAPLVFAAREVREALEANGFLVAEEGLDEMPRRRPPVRIVIALAGGEAARQRMRQPGATSLDTLGPQAYAIRIDKASRDAGTSYWAIGADPVGAMYGGLHIAEEIRLRKGLGAVGQETHAPYIARRGIKFNIPLDARTPSYDDTGDAAQTNIVHMWDFAFWEEFLDDMARHRYNTLTLWNPHPFPSLVKCPNFPDVALSDVGVTTADVSDQGGKFRRPMFAHADLIENLKVVKRMSIDDKIEHWRRVMKHAKDRGIDIYFITWNVLTNGAEGKYGITNQQDNPNTIAYLRECTRELILTYPLLAGIGVTAGENMSTRDDEFDKEKWLWKTYGLGVLDAKKVQPDRTVRFIHRVWQTGVEDVMKDFGQHYPDPFELSFKYMRAHMYSATSSPFADELCGALKPHGLKCWWNLRNDDIFNFRWGDPDYAREFLRNLPDEVTAGYHMGSDGYVWGREFTSRRPRTPRQLEMKKHWYNFMLWGRLGYDPDLDRAFFERVLADRFPDAPAAQLYDAWATASKIIPLVNRFHWKDWDFMWAVEGCFDQRHGFHTIDDFIHTAPMERSGMISIRDYVARSLANQPIEGTTPIQVAAELRGHVARVLHELAEMRLQIPRRETAEPNSALWELHQTLGDIEAMAQLGNYYAAKILGAYELCMLRQTRDQRRREAALRHLEDALAHWRQYAAIAGSQYHPQLLARTRQLDWTKLLDDVKGDLEIVRTEPVN